MKKKILITGYTGHLGSFILNHFKNIYNCKIIEKSYLNKNEFKSFEKIIKNFSPDFFINCAAIVGLKKSLSNKKKTLYLNTIFLKKLSKLSNKYKFHIIHFSTNSVFENSSFKTNGYNENDIPAPTSFYGKTKLDGEKELIKNSNKYTIIRISNLYSHDLAFKTNFLSKIITDLKKGNAVVKRRQLISPVNIKSVLLSVRDIIINNSSGVFHCSDSGFCSWEELIKYISKKLKIKTRIIYNYDNSKFNSIALSSINSFSNYNSWKHGIDYSLKLIRTSE